MPWKLIQSHDSPKEIPLSLQSRFDIVLLSGRLSVRSTNSSPQPDTLAHITVGHWGVKLNALKNDVVVRPAHPRSHPQAEPAQEEYRLKPSELIFLREGDRIWSIQSSCGLALEWDPTEIQVNSSITPTYEIPESEDAVNNSDNVTSNGHFGRNTSTSIFNQDDMDRHGNTTPRPSDVQASMVAETPAARRYGDVKGIIPSFDNAVENPEEVEDTQPGNTAAPLEASMTDLTKPTAALEPVVWEEETEGEEDQDVQDVQSVMYSRAVDAVEREGGDVDQETRAALSSKDTPSRKENVVYLDEEETADEEEETRGESVSVGAIKPDSPSSPTRMAVQDRDTEDEEATDDDKLLLNFKLPSPSRPADRRRNVEVKITRRGVKRATPTDAEDSPGSLPSHPPKRVKKEDEVSPDSSFGQTGLNTTTKKVQRMQRRSLTEIEKSVSPVATTRMKLSSDHSAFINPKVAFSNTGIPDDGSFIRFLKSHGGRVVENAKKDNFDILCVKPGPLRIRMKLLLGVALGVPIVTDNWLKDSTKKGYFLPADEYIPNVPESEKEYGFSMSQIWGEPRDDLLKGKTVYFTRALEKTYQSFSEIQTLCKAVGAKQVKVPKALKDFKIDENSLIIALEEDDEDAIALAEDGYTCYNKDLLTASILRGELRLKDFEYQITPTLSQEKKKPAASRGRGKARGRGRKSRG